MIAIRTLRQIATSRTIRSFRSCKTPSRTHYSLIRDQGRMMMGYAEVLTEEAQRQWRCVQWQRRR